MKIRIEDLTNEQLDYWMARSRGWVSCVNVWAEHPSGKCVDKSDYSPTTSPAQWAELIEEFNIHLSQDILGGWMAGYPKGGGYHWNNKCDTPAIAICRAVVASVFGEYVEVPDAPAR